MAKKALVVYTSFTGNTEKVALRFKATFEKNGWDCDIFKVEKKADHILRPPFDVHDYDFLCAGSGLRAHLPYNEVLNYLRRFRLGMDPRFALRFRDETIPYIDEPLRVEDDPGPLERHRKMVLGPDSKKGVIFITYGGYEFGPKEAVPALELLALEIEHFGFRCVGKFSCPGKFLDDPTPNTYHGDIRHRPDARDLSRAGRFLEEKLEEIEERIP